MSAAKFKTEYAKSGRAGCKICKQPIAKDTMRVAQMKASPFHDGMDAHWAHPACFKKSPKWPKPKEISEVDGYLSLKFEDQKRLEELCSGYVLYTRGAAWRCWR